MGEKSPAIGAVLRLRQALVEVGSLASERRVAAAHCCPFDPRLVADQIPKNAARPPG
jgi:hypothetical protein